MAAEFTYDILNCGPRKRFAVNTSESLKLVSNSGGDKQNAQNLTRVNYKDPTSGALRRSLLAPPGHLLVVRDLGQIEARMLAYWAGQEDLLELFRQGGDPYNRQATEIYGYAVNRKKPEFQLEGMAGKASVLGCFGAETNVLTNRGSVAIVNVKDTDMVWDGIEFVPHAGVIYQGEKKCLTSNGVSATPDHEILTEHGWVEWREVHTKSSLFQSAISRGSLPSSNGDYAEGRITKILDIIRLFDALVAGKVLSTEVISKLESPRGAISARSRQAARLLKNLQAMLQSSPMTIIANAYLTESLPASNDATTLKIDNTITTVGEVYSFTQNGLRTEQNFLHTLLRCLDGMYRIWSLIERTTTKGMNLVTYGSLQELKMQVTEDLWGSYAKNSSDYEKKRKTYDIALAGPRNRYTVLTTKGPIIVHNCGYQMGWSKFQEGLRVGFMGMPSILFSSEDTKKLGADLDAFCYQRSYKKGFNFLREEALAMKPLNVGETEHLWHCAAVKQIVDKYRESNAAIVAGWREAGQALVAIEGGAEIPVGKRGLIYTCAEGFLLPNGMKIRYNKLRSNEKREFRYLSNVRKKEWSYIYSGKCVENIVQALSRIVLTDQMLTTHQWLQKQQKSDPINKYKVVTSTHDEIVCCVPEQRAAECLRVMEIVMGTAPPWCPDLPLKSSGGYAQNYGDCEK